MFYCGRSFARALPCGEISGISAAARLLRRSDLNIQQIIAQVGYENTSYFYRLFHERYGLSPREYRLVRTGTAPRRPTA